MSKYYRTKISIEVLSEEPIEDISLDDLQYEITEGHWVGSMQLILEPKELTPKEAADALYEFGSDPGFFQLDDDGKKVDDA